LAWVESSIPSSKTSSALLLNQYLKAWSGGSLDYVGSSWWAGLGGFPPNESALTSAAVTLAVV